MSMSSGDCTHSTMRSDLLLKHLAIMEFASMNSTKCLALTEYMTAWLIAGVEAVVDSANAK